MLTNLAFGYENVCMDHYVDYINGCVHCVFVYPGERVYCHTENCREERENKDYFIRTLETRGVARCAVEGGRGWTNVPN